jgi:hypothetical protein
MRKFGVLDGSEERSGEMPGGSGWFLHVLRRRHMGLLAKQCLENVADELEARARIDCGL